MTARAYDACDEGCNSLYWEKGRNLQIVDRVLLGCTVAGAVTTAVLYFLTDFDGTGEDADDATVSASVVPVIGENSGMMMLRGRF
jgi:hypothetical protein